MKSTPEVEAVAGDLLLTVEDAETFFLVAWNNPNQSVLFPQFQARKETGSEYFHTTLLRLLFEDLKRREQPLEPLLLYYGEATLLEGYAPECPGPYSKTLSLVLDELLSGQLKVVGSDLPRMFLEQFAIAGIEIEFDNFANGEYPEWLEGLPWLQLILNEAVNFLLGAVPQPGLLFGNFGRKLVKLHELLGNT